MYIPKRVRIELTNKCGAKCNYCAHQKMTREQGIMSQEVFEKVIADSKKLLPTLQWVYLHGIGESLLDPKVFDRISYTRENLPTCLLTLNTTAYNLTKAKSKKLINSGLDVLIVSMSGSSSEDYKKYETGMTYSKVETNIRYLIENNSDWKVNIILQIVSQDVTMPKYEEVRAKWKDFPVGVAVKRIHPFLDTNQDLVSGIEAQNHICGCVNDTILVYWNGELGLCCWDYDNFYKIGNIKDDTLLNLHNNDKMESLRSSMKGGAYLEIKPCSICDRFGA
jgi:radical SAM protein with 4Fe4S-binding SPASM domain